MLTVIILYAIFAFFHVWLYSLKVRNKNILEVLSKIKKDENIPMLAWLHGELGANHVKIRLFKVVEVALGITNIITIIATF